MEKKPIEHRMSTEGEQNDRFHVATELEGIHGAQVKLEETEQGHLMTIKGGHKEGEVEEDDEDDILRAA